MQAAVYVFADPDVFLLDLVAERDGLIRDATAAIPEPLENSECLVRA